jgi:TolA-binding protein
MAAEKMAQVSFQSGDYGAALGFYDRALIHAPGDKKPLLEARKITSLYRLGRISEASKARRSFEKTYGQDSTAIAGLLMEEGLAYLELKDGQAAGKSFQAVIEGYPTSALASQAEYQLGLAALSAGDFRGALKRFQSLLERNPQVEIKATVLFKMGSTLYGLEQYPDAAQHYQQAADETRDQALRVDALFNVGICRAKMNDWDGAIATYGRLLGEFGQHQDWHKWALRLGFAYLESDQPAQALKIFQQVDPGGDAELGAEVQFWVGECYFKMGQYERAAQEYLRVAFLYPGQDQWAATSEYNAGVSYEKLGRMEEARTIYRKLLRSRAAGDQWAQMAQERLKDLETE